MDFAVNALVILSLAGQVAAEAPEKTELAKALQSLYRREAAEYEFALDSARKEKLKLLEKPVMSWTGQNAGFVSGDVFVWTRNGRAEVIGCIGSLPGETSRGVFHEFHALTDKPLPEVEIATGRRWRPRQPGVITKPVPGAAVPGATGARRMLEMRNLARQFTSRMQARSGEERLRLLPQPIYRYDTKSLAASNLPVSDGAIFAYVWTRGTDPEFLLLLADLPGKSLELRVSPR